VKVIGLIGGMSWESTVPYYRLINEMVQQRLGGYHSAKIVLVSVDFAEIERMQRDNRWDEAGTLLGQAAATLETAGAGFVVLCTNTMHKVAPAIETAVSIPLLHIADATGEAIGRSGLHSIALLGTRFTMEQDFYRERLQEKYGLDILVPELDDREIVNRVIFDELVRGRLLSESRAEYRRIIARLVDSGAQGVILGCTEISLLVSQDDAPVPLFDTTSIHAAQAVEQALAE
jgi:aspartate racemase